MVDLQAVTAVLQQCAPLELAESWDNVGLLVEPSAPHSVQRVFLCNDLTEPVLEEAIDKRANLIVAYHPPIFQAMKRLTQSDVKQRIVVRCIENRIAVYSPHTASDSVVGGVNDWLVSGLSRYGFDPSFAEPLHDSAAAGAGAHPGTGAGRLVRCDANSPGLPLSTLVQAIKEHLNLRHVRVAIPVGFDNTMPIRSVAVCAGSGSSVVRGAQADLYWSGEMGHHDVLAATAENRAVVLCEHSNTERGYLAAIGELLTKQLQNHIEVLISAVDRDPLQIH